MMKVMSTTGHTGSIASGAEGGARAGAFEMILGASEAAPVAATAEKTGNPSVAEGSATGAEDVLARVKAAPAKAPRLNPLHETMTMKESAPAMAEAETSEPMKPKRVWTSEEEVVDFGNDDGAGSEVEATAKGRDLVLPAIPQEVVPAPVTPTISAIVAELSEPVDSAEAEGDETAPAVADVNGEKAPDVPLTGATSPELVVPAAGLSHGVEGANPELPVVSIAASATGASASEEMKPEATQPKLREAIEGGIEPAWAKEKATTLPAVATAIVADKGKSQGAMVEARTAEPSSVAASHAMKVVRTLEIVEAADRIDVVEGEVVDHGDNTAAQAPIDAPEMDVKTTQPVSSPLNLGKASLSLGAQELLQDSGANLGAHVIAAGGMTAAPQASAYAQHAMPYLRSEHLVTTSTQHLATDVALPVVKEVRAGNGEVSIRLDPAELGRIEIKMTFAEDGRMRAVIAADNPSTYDLLRRDVDALVRTLADAGVKTDASDLKFDMRQGNQSGQQGYRAAWAEQFDRGEESQAGDAENDMQPRPMGRGRLV